MDRACGRAGVLRGHLLGPLPARCNVLSQELASGTNHQFVFVKKDSGVAIITLHRPEALNALCPQVHFPMECDPGKGRVIQLMSFKHNSLCESLCRHVVNVMKMKR